MSEKSETLHLLCGRLAYPVKAPVGTFQLVFFRSFTILSTLCVFVVSLLSLILLPWKIEMLEGRTLEFGVWKICKLEPLEPSTTECFSEFYDHQTSEDVWFQAFRYSMLIGTIIQFLCFVSIITLTTFKSDQYVKPWPIFSSGFLIAGSLTFFSLIIFDVQFELGFAEDARIMMDWTEESEIEEIMGNMYTVAWVSVGGVLLNSYLCYYTKCTEEAFRKKHTPNKEKLLLENDYIQNGKNRGL